MKFEFVWLLTIFNAKGALETFGSSCGRSINSAVVVCFVR
ncbi:hypothetical protein J635_1429 [Acinetobacter baumannii 233846]|nr:hypothetical protein J635_1429 [Acinetobacter baumannii 233846]